MATVTVANESTDAQAALTPSLTSADRMAAASVAAPNAPETSVATVTPICTADRKRFGSWASFAARWPRLPRCASCRTWPSRSETRAISAPEKNPPMSKMTRTMMTSPTTSFTAYSRPPKFTLTGAWVSIPWTAARPGPGEIAARTACAPGVSTV